VTAAILGASAIFAAAIFALLGSMATGRGPSHTADVTGLAALVDQLQEERDRLAAMLAECQDEARRLRGEHG
jgi:outer membrane murein-binding lipoprotein Lpp